MQALAALALALFVVPLGFAADSGILAFVGFCIFWVLAWLFAERTGGAEVARLCVGALGVRVVIASFELFESLLLTGSVLVMLGLVALIWSRRSLQGTATPASVQASKEDS